MALSTPPFVIALVGRPNVGKSTLFNRLCGRRAAMVHDMPGVTRDRRYGEGRIAGLQFTVIDTPGFDRERGSTKGTDLSKSLWEQTEEAIRDASLILFVVDGREGLLPSDSDYARHVRRSGKPCVIVVNKAESKVADPVIAEAQRLGFGEPVPLSAEHGEGMMGLYEALEPFAPPQDGAEEIIQDNDGETTDEGELNDEEAPDGHRPLRLAIVGQPNAGKSTLINQLIGSSRFLTGPLAGLTRESQAVDFEWEGRPIQLIDTAGLRKKAKVTDGIEKMSVQDTLRAIQYAQAVCLVIDATVPLERQDLTIAHLVVEEGRMLLIVINKMDLITDVDTFIRNIRLEVAEQLPQISFLPVVCVSALRKKNLATIFKHLFDLYGQWTMRLSTNKVNNWLHDVLAHHPPPISKGRRIQIRYMTQIKTRPPTFVLFMSRPEDLPTSYLRYLRNQLAEHFHLKSVPLRLLPKKGKNPYA